MPTNEERREVAKELRYTASHSLNGYSFQRAVEGIVFGTLVDRPWRETLTRIANLIEPEPERTCTFSVYKTGDEHFPTCSACGYEAAREECEDYVGVVYYEKRHCPNCGAKVVSDV